MVTRDDVFSAIEWQLTRFKIAVFMHAPFRLFYNV